MVKLKKVATFTKGLRKKIKIKTKRTKLKNIIPSIWIEKWNWKSLNFLQKKPGEEIRNPNNKDYIGEYNIWFKW